MRCNNCQKIDRRELSQFYTSRTVLDIVTLVAFPSSNAVIYPVNNPDHDEYDVKFATNSKTQFKVSFKQGQNEVLIQYLEIGIF